MIELIEFYTLTKESLLSHIFLEEADHEIQKITTKPLAKNPKENLDELRTMVITTETLIVTNQEEVGIEPTGQGKK